ncbi:OprO/OprP family phosphate-selective porin [Sphingobacterium sp. lm-10]|uniref:porin n=1 Tax=Sphingobacterium sp. lm-10 TaxID=2944904 RepID=UPI002020E4E2|nr:porin [Sphingobacterium sp. lm-10]MCL7986970.1 OprO/OprP family phosphate-selective porin [Sphingobacterium sp. lm-10]
MAQEKSSITTQEKPWYQAINMRGYVQARYNRLLETNPNLGCEQCDASWGEGGGFFLRRVRLIFSGQLNDRIYFYIQPDFASSAQGGLNYGQLRDAYFDLGLDAKNEFRLRIGQSKVPYGFENMQSSQNRLPLDRADGTNSALRNERDLGVFFYWAPQEKRRLFAELIAKGLKGSGDYGVFAFGVYNGQTANNPEGNKGMHVVSRFSYPMELGDQIIEPGLQAYTGRFIISQNRISEGISVDADRDYLDQRVAASFVLYPQPFGIQAEYNIGRGPEYNGLQQAIDTKSLAGGYVTLSYMTQFKNQIFIPFTRLQQYKGGKKHEQDARSYDVKELELGVEWQPSRYFELVAMYTISSRRYEDQQLPNNLQRGNLLRLQAQLNF